MAKAKPFHGSGIQELLRRAPAELLDTPLDRIRLPVRVRNRLRLLGLEQVADLRGVTDVDLLSLDGFGLSSLLDLREALQLHSGAAAKPDVPEERSSDEVESDESVSAAPEQKTLWQEDPTDFAATFAGFLTQIDGRSREILEARIGLDCAPMTLEELGEKYGVSRERIRQVQKKALHRLTSWTTTKSRLESAISERVSSRASPLYLVCLPLEVPWLRHVKTSERLLGFLIDHILQDYHVFQLYGRRLVSRISEDEWLRRLQSARSFVEASRAKRTPEETLRVAVRAIAGKDAAELASEIWKHATALAHFVEVDGERRVVAYGRGVEQMVSVVLERANEPMHYSEIARQVEALFGPQEIRRVHNSAEIVGVLLGRGIYGLRRHIPVTTKQAKYLSALCEAIVRSGPGGRQWHASELLAEIQEEEPLANSISQFGLSALLATESTLQYVGRQVWTERAGSRSGKSVRLAIRNAIEAVLEDEGRPMTTIDIFRRINELRGFGETFQINPKGRLIRIAPGTWGLLDRDVTLSRVELDACLADLEERLKSVQRAIHVSEILRDIGRVELPDQTGWHILGAAQVDGRFRVAAGDLLCLSGWSGTNRKTVQDAIAELLPLITEGVGTDELVSIVQDEIGRATSHDVVRAALRAGGAEWDRVLSKWVFRPDSDSGSDLGDGGMAS